MALPVVRSILEKEIFLVSWRDRDEDDPVSIRDPFGSEVCATVESIMNPTFPAGTDFRVGINVDWRTARPG